MSSPTAVPGHHVKPQAIAMMLGMALCFAVLETTAKWLSRSYPVPVVVWVRYAVHVGLMLLIFAPAMGTALVRTAQPGGQLGRAVLMLGSTLCNFGAVAFLPLAEVKAISFVSPLLVALLAVWLLGENVSRARWVAILVGFGATLFIVRPGSAMLNPAVLLALGSAGCYSLYQILTRKVSADDDPRTSLFYTALVGAVLMTFRLPHVWHPLRWQDAPLFLLLGGAGMTGHYLLIKALEIEHASALSPFGYTQLLWIGLTGWVVFGDFPDAHSLIGMSIIVASGLYVAWGHRVTRRDEEPDSAIE
ncbi:MAG: DMT family transporter [Betaproteobacteria bacterium]